VGYGDIAPQTGWGKALASLAMVLGYGIIAVPTGIVTVGLTQAQAGQRQAESDRLSGRSCLRCGLGSHQADARYCRRCGEALPDVLASDPA
jgi:voltage-gated potassium channel